MGETSHTVLTEQEKHARLRLIRSDGIGPVSFAKMLSFHGSADATIRHLLNTPSQGKRQIEIFPEAATAAEISTHEKMGASLLFLGEPDYPKTLAAIADAPPVLSVIGNASLLSQQNIGVVGARNASASGLKLTRMLCKRLAESHMVITSGMARGIDAAAHEAALPYGTIACMAGGVDVIYPQDNSQLYHQIAEQGVLISEMPLGTRPQAPHFPRRNRLISGLGAGLLVIEAAKKSGSLITARFAADQGREVFAVPGSPLDPRAQGANQLIKDGATLTQSAEDILNELSDMPLLRQPVRRMHSAPLASPRKTVERATSPEKPTTDHLASSASSPTTIEACLLSLLSPEPVHVDEIVRLSGTPTEKVLSEFMSLELGGQVQRHSGNRFSRISMKNE